MATMRAAVLGKYGNTADVQCGEAARPGLQPGEVLVRVESSPINPSDLYFIRGNRANLPPLPTIPGLEGAGVVVETTPGNEHLMGKRVHTYRIGSPTNSMWAEYAVSKAEHCVPLSDSVDLDQGACLYVNPMTVLMFREIIREGKHRAAVQDVANSALGKMLNRICKLDNIPLINIVRSESSAEMLRKEGFEFILDSSQVGFDQDLKTLCTRLNATVGFDAIAGPAAGRMMSGLCAGGVVYVYSGLSGQPSEGFSASDLIFQGKSFEGRMMPMWLAPKSQEERAMLFEEVQRLLPTVFYSEFVGHFGLSEVQSALNGYIAQMSAGKVLIHPGR